VAVEPVNKAHLKNYDAAIAVTHGGLCGAILGLGSGVITDQAVAALCAGTFAGAFIGWGSTRGLIGPWVPTVAATAVCWLMVEDGAGHLTERALIGGVLLGLAFCLIPKRLRFSLLYLIGTYLTMQCTLPELGSHDLFDESRRLASPTALTFAFLSFFLWPMLPGRLQSCSKLPDLESQPSVDSSQSTQPRNS
jgi:hypothetical protein